MKQAIYTIAIFIIYSCSSSDESSNPSSTISTFNVTQNSSKLSFNYSSNGVMSYYEISYQLSSNGNNANNGQKFSSNNPNSIEKTISELSIQTSESYSFYIRGFDSNNNASEWFGPTVLNIGQFCEIPYDISFNGNLSWDTYYNQTQASYFQVQYGLQGFQIGNGTTIQTNDESTSELVLQQGNAYDAYVRSYCTISLGWSNWVGPISYYANSNSNVCTLPNNLGYSTEYNFFGQPIGANITWNDSGNNKKYEFNLVGNNQSPDTSAIEFRDDYGTQITYTQISPNTQYDFYVRTVCVDGSRTNWVGPLDVIIN